MKKPSLRLRFVSFYKKRKKKKKNVKKRKRKICKINVKLKT